MQGHRLPARLKDMLEGPNTNHSIVTPALPRKKSHRKTPAKQHLHTTPSPGHPYDLYHIFSSMPSITSSDISCLDCWKPLQIIDMCWAIWFEHR